MRNPFLYTTKCLRGVISNKEFKSILETIKTKKDVKISGQQVKVGGATTEG